MNRRLRDIYVPSERWKVIVDAVAPQPRGMDPAFSRSLEAFRRYSATISGDIGDAIRRCHDHLERFLAAAQAIVAEEAGNHPGRLGRLREFPYGMETLSFQVFDYKGIPTTCLREDHFAELLTKYDLFHDTMRFMEKKVEEGDLGILQNSFVFIHKPMEQAAVVCDAALEKMPLERTGVIGKKADPTYVHITGTESCPEIESGCICRVLKPGYVYDKREIQEGVVMVAE
ncbi:MAG: nucleotide exchange factor GrpE [Candidatus Omnitrophota bacterium]|jgi:hypothetical protein|nr:MAG: nucleotide exchange factor GrpE [Candidatus Omnitrophota bacterium]